MRSQDLFLEINLAATIESFGRVVKKVVNGGCSSCTGNYDNLSLLIKSGSTNI